MERQLIEFLLTEAKVVSKAVVDKCEVKSREIFQENFRATRNKVKNKSKGYLLHWGLGTTRDG